MTDHYCQKSDLSLIRELKKLAPNEFKPWAELDGIVRREDGAVPPKYRELIALAVALTTQCAYCIEVHVRGAKRVGASREELAETVFLAAALKAGSAAAHGALALRLFDEQAG